MLIRLEEHCRSIVIPGTVTGQVEPLGALLHGGAHDHVVDFTGLDFGALDGVLENVSTHGRRFEIVEGAPIGSTNGGPCSGNDHSIVHSSAPLSNTGTGVKSE
jgi:hypothetical protein